MVECLLIGFTIVVGAHTINCLIDGPAPRREYKPSPWHFGVGHHIVSYKEGKGYYRVDTEE